jgi:hypothetical protein
MFYYTVSYVIASVLREAISHATNRSNPYSAYYWRWFSLKNNRDDNFGHPCYLLFGSLAILVTNEFMTLDP